MRSAPFASIVPQCSCSALSAYMCDGQVAHSYKPAVSDFVNVNIACSCSDRMNHSKECVYKHEDDGGMFWILDLGASTHFILHCLDCIDYIYMVYIGVAVTRVSPTVGEREQRVLQSRT